MLIFAAAIMAYLMGFIALAFFNPTHAFILRHLEGAKHVGNAPVWLRAFVAFFTPALLFWTTVMVTIEEGVSYLPKAWWEVLDDAYGIIVNGRSK